MPAQPLHGHVGQVINPAPTTPPPSPVKPPCTGVGARNLSAVGTHDASSAHPLGFVVANLNHSDLCPNDDGTIDTSNASWTDLLRCLATGLPVSMRIFHGTHSAPWLKALDSPTGSGLPVVEPLTGATGTCPYWWKPGPLNRVDSFIATLAVTPVGDGSGLNVEQHPQIRDVHVDIATTFYVEKTQRGNGSAANRAAYIGAGLAGVQLDAGGRIIGADPLDAAAIGHIDRAQGDRVAGGASWWSTHFPTTKRKTAFTPLQAWQDTGGGTSIPVNDPASFTESEINRAAHVLISLGLLGNHSWTGVAASKGKKYPQVWAALRSCGAAMYLQTETPARLQAAYQKKHLDGAGNPSPVVNNNEALLAALSTAFGAARDGATTWATANFPALRACVWAGSDPEGLLVSPPMVDMAALAVELPTPWNLTDAQIDYYNALGATMPTGGL